MNNCIFKVLRSGINTTYQDEGRFGFQHLGIPPGGCMDNKSFLVANVGQVMKSIFFKVIFQKFFLKKFNLGNPDILSIILVLNVNK